MDEKCGEAGRGNVDMWLRVVRATFGFVKTHHVDSHSQTVTAEQGRAPARTESAKGSFSFLEIDVYGASTDGQLQIGDRDRAGDQSACRRVRHRSRAYEEGRASRECGEPLVPYTTNTSY